MAPRRRKLVERLWDTRALVLGVDVDLGGRVFDIIGLLFSGRASYPFATKGDKDDKSREFFVGWSSENLRMPMAKTGRFGNNRSDGGGWTVMGVSKLILTIDPGLRRQNSGSGAKCAERKTSYFWMSFSYSGISL